MNNKKAFTDTIKANEGLIYKVAKVYANNREDEQDLYQEIVYQLWKSFESFRNEARVSTWMYRIALNTSIAFLNSTKRKVKQEAVNEALENIHYTDYTIEREQIEELYAAIKQLNTIEKGLILLYLEGKPYDEIAVITGFTVTNVGTRLARIRQKLTSHIKK